MPEQFVVHFSLYPLGNGRLNLAPTGLPYYPAEDANAIPAGQTWATIGEYDFAGLAEAYAAADAAVGGEYGVEIFDRDNLQRIYSTSPYIASLSADQRAAISPFLSHQDGPGYLRNERNCWIMREIWRQIVVRRDPVTGGPLSSEGGPVTQGYFIHPAYLPATDKRASWLAILRAAQTRPRISGQAGRDLAAEQVAWYGDPDPGLPPAIWAPSPA